MGGAWPGAAYYSLCAHKYLPIDIDRILYLDTADVIIINSIDDYYFDDFENKTLLVTANNVYKIKAGKEVLFEKEDLKYPQFFQAIARGIFNSGSYVINLDKMRQQNSNINNYFECSKMLYDLKEHIPKDYFKGKTNLGNWGDQVYWGDQGFLSLVFVGDVKYFAYPEIVDLWYMPYNFGVWYFDKTTQPLNYIPAIMHFVGVLKPWRIEYPIFLKRFQNKNDLHKLNCVNTNKEKCYQIWYQYAIMADNRLNHCKIKGL